MAQEALELWRACDSVKRIRIDELAKGLREMEILLSKSKNLVPVGQIEFQVPKSYPVGLDDFLKFALPRKRPEDRMKLYRENIRASLRHDRCYPGTSGSVTAITFDQGDNRHLF